MTYATLNHSLFFIMLIMVFAFPAITLIGNYIANRRRPETTMDGYTETKFMNQEAIHTEGLSREEYDLIEWETEHRETCPMDLLIRHPKYKETHPGCKTCFEKLWKADNCYAIESAWVAEHDCPCDRFAIVPTARAVGPHLIPISRLQPCCTECFPRIWEPAGARINHDHELQPAA